MNVTLLQVHYILTMNNIFIDSSTSKICNLLYELPGPTFIPSMAVFSEPLYSTRVVLPGTKNTNRTWVLLDSLTPLYYRSHSSDL